MGRNALLLAVTLMLGHPAFAHPGHLAEVAGHGHWVAGAAIGAAIVLGLWAGLKGRAASSSDQDMDQPEDEGEAEPA